MLAPQAPTLFPSCFKAIAMSLLSPSGVADVGRVRSKCSFVGQLNELAASVKADPKDYPHLAYSDRAPTGPSRRDQGHRMAV